MKAAWEQAGEGEVYCVTRYRDHNQNLRTQLTKIICRAGLTPWPKLFQKLQPSRETQLTSQFPLHVVTSWLGNTPRVAMRHYLMTTDEHFAQATRGAKSGAVQCRVH